MKYSKDLFLYNLKYLVSYDFEPEITIKLKNNNSVFIVAYKDYIDITVESNETIRTEKVEDIFNLIDFDSVTKIEGELNFEFPIETQSVVVDGVLWIDATLPNQVISKFKRELFVFRTILLTALTIALACFLIVISHNDNFGLDDIIMCSVLGVAALITLLFFTIYDIRRNRIIKKYYGSVSEEDKIIAKELLDKIQVVDNNEYDFFNLFHYDIDDLAVKQSLKSLIKGKKVNIGLYDPIKAVKYEIETNNIDDKYSDIEFNNYIFELISLLERNLCDI